MKLGLGLWLGSSAVAAAAGGPVNGDPLSVTISDGTAIDTNWFLNGAAATTRFKGLSTGGTADASKLTLTVTRPGYDATGAATNYSVSIAGRLPLRRAGSNATSKVQITAGSDVDIPFVPVRRVFATETATAALSAGAYTGSNAISGLAVTNSSTLAFPKPAVNVHAPAHRTVRADSTSADPRTDLSSTRTGEIIVVSPHAQAGRPVACIKVRCLDSAEVSSPGTGHATAWTTVTAMARSSYGTLNGLQADVFAYSIDVSALNHGDCFDEYEVYPWWGTSATVFASVTNGDALLTTATDRTTVATTVGTINPANRIHWFYNKNNETEQFANVDPQNVTGNASDAWTAAQGVATTQAACDALAKPFLTIHGAAVALQSANNALGRNDLGNCFISCMAGSYYGPGSAMSSRVYGSNWLVIRLHPSANAGDAIFRSLQADNTTAVTTKDWGRRAWFRGIVWSGAVAGVANSNNYLNSGLFTAKNAVFLVEQVHEGGSFASTTSKAGITELYRQNGFNWFIDTTFTGAPNLQPAGNSVSSFAHFFGCAYTGADGTAGPFSNLVTGTAVTNAAISGDFRTGTGSGGLLESIFAASRDIILTFNRVFWDNTITGSGIQLMQSLNTTSALPTNSYSWTHSQASVHYTGGTTVKVMQFTADGQERPFAAPAWALLAWSTHAGERTNYCYNQAPATTYAEKNGFTIGMAMQNHNMKSDAEATADANRTGNALPRHYVDGYGNAIISQANSGAVADPGYDSWVGEVMPGNYKAANLGFTTDTSRTGTGTNVLPDLRPAAGSTMLGLIPAGSQPTKSYLGGAARDNSVAGPCGCREAA